MAGCECLEKCAFFHDRMENMPAMAEMLKNRYCLGDYRACARHRVFERLGREAVPGDLFPADAEYADRILSAG